MFEYILIHVDVGGIWDKLNIRFWRELVNILHATIANWEGVNLNLFNWVKESIFYVAL